MSARAKRVGLTPAVMTTTGVMLLHVALFSCAEPIRTSVHCRSHQGGCNRAEMRNFHNQPIPQEAINVRGE